MKVKYKLVRKEGVVEDFRNDQRLVERIKQQLQGKRKSINYEQNLGTEPIPVKDFLYNKLEI